MEHADFALAVMSRTLKDQAPSAAEGGKTSQQVKNTDGLWETLCQMHESQAKDQYTTSDIEVLQLHQPRQARRSRHCTDWVRCDPKAPRALGRSRPRKGHYQFEN